MSWTDILPQIADNITTTDIINLENNTPSELLYPLCGYSFLEISGPDRFSFLQGQATCDTDRLAKGETLLGAHLNLQGRIEASFIAFPTENSLLLLMPHHRAEHLCNQLQKYILFSQAEMSINQQLLPFLVWGEPKDNANLYQNPAIKHLYFGYCQPANWQTQLAHTAMGDSDLAAAILIRNGLYLVNEQSQSTYLPQELNYDKLDGISFNKGCYKGQEIVARIHFKGQVKQRLQVVKGASNPCSNLTAVVNNEQKIGAIITSHSINSTLYGCILLKTSQTESKPIYLEQNDGPELQLLPLPYAIT